MRCLARTLVSLLLVATPTAAQAWLQQGPIPTNVELYAVDFVDAQLGWVAGGNAIDGGIWNTTDGGATWSLQLAAGWPGLIDIKDLQMLDANVGWAVGNANSGSFFGEAIYRTFDGGLNWQEAPLPTPPSGANPVMATKVQFVSNLVGFVSTRPAPGISYLYRTTDGGQSWQYLREVALNSWSFVDGNVGWAAATDQSYIRTNDGGQTWSTVPQPVAASLGSSVTRVFSYDDAVTNTFLSLAQGFRVHRTTNGGQSWTAASGSTFAEQFFLDGQTGWAINKGVAKTTDGGLTWTTTLVDGDLTETTWDLSIVDANTLYLAGGFGLLLRSVDGGATWQQVSNGSGQDLRAVRFATHDVGWAVGEGHTVLRTEDAGQTWSIQNTGLSVFNAGASPTDVFVFSEQSAIVQVGRFPFTHSGFVLTDDGGQTWTRPTNWPLGEGYFSDRQHGWLVDRYATTMWVTDDGGATWTTRPTGIPAFSFNEYVADVYFADDQYGWLVGYHSRAYRTTNGGLSWTRIPSFNGISSTYTIVRFADREHGWVTAGHGMIVRTEDGGVTWTDQTIPNSVDEPAQDLVVLGPDEAYICSGDAWNGLGSLLGGFVRHTIDGGATWDYEVNQLFDGYLSGLAVVGGDLWAVGTEGAMFHSPGVRGTVVPYGSGCPGSNGQPLILASDDEPIVRRSFTQAVGGATANTIGLLAFGFSDTQWGGVPLPLSLGAFGGNPACLLLAAGHVQEPLVFDAAGEASLEVVLPPLLGAQFYTQAWAFDPLLPTQPKLVASQGLAIQIGGR